MEESKYAMLNSFQHLIKLVTYQTLNQVQGNKQLLFQL